jgi:hypothetical protein
MGVSVFVLATDFSAINVAIPGKGSVRESLRAGSSAPRLLLRQPAAFSSYAAVGKCTEIRNLRLINLEGG